MKRTLKAAAWALLALVAVFVWFTFPEIQPAVAWGAGAAMAYHVMSRIVEEVTTRVVSAELVDLKRQNNTQTERLDAVDRKVSALLKDALERRRSVGG